MHSQDLEVARRDPLIHRSFYPTSRNSSWRHGFIASATSPPAERGPLSSRALVIAGVAGAYTAFHGKLSNTFTMPGTQTQQLSDELAQRFPSANRGSGQIILTTGDGTALTEEQKQAFSTALNKLTGEVSSVDAVTDPFTTTSKLAEAKPSSTGARQD